jgi:hypothetical protein
MKAELKYAKASSLFTTGMPMSVTGLPCETTYDNTLYRYRKAINLGMILLLFTSEIH